MRQKILPPVDEPESLKLLYKLASDLQQGRIKLQGEELRNAVSLQMQTISSILPTSGPANELYLLFENIIKDFYEKTSSSSTAKDLGYALSAPLNKKGNKTTQPGKIPEQPRRKNEFITENPTSFESIVQNATYGGMKAYLEGKGGVQNLSQEEIEFLQPLLISNQAISDYNQYRKDPSYLSSTYGNYSKGNDCFTYAVIGEPNKALGESYNPSSNIARETLNGKEKQRLSLETGKKFYPLSKVSTIDLQVGDMVGVNLSPNNTGNNHWGIVALDENGNPTVISRNTSEIDRRSIEEFFSLASGVDIIRYGQSNYAEHIRFDPSSGQVQVVRGSEPGSFIE